MTRLSFDSGASAYERFSTLFSELFVPRLLAAARIRDGQRVLDVAAGTGATVVEAAKRVGGSGLVLATDLSLPMLQKGRSKFERMPVRLAVMNGQALACGDASFDAVVCHLGLMFFPDAQRGLCEFARVLRPNAWTAVAVTTTPERTVYGRVFAAAQRFLPAGRGSMGWNFAIRDAASLEALLSGAKLRDVSVTPILEPIRFESRQDYWASMEAGMGISGASYVALREGDRAVVRDEVERQIGAKDTPFTVEAEVLIGSARR